MKKILNSAEPSIQNDLEQIESSDASTGNRSPLQISLKFYVLLVCLSLLVVLQTSSAQSSQVGSLDLHTVSANETLFSIAQRYGTSVDEIVAKNQLTGKTIYVGQRLYLPINNALSTQATPPSGNSSLVTVERRGFYVTIAPGESLLGIALRYGVAIGELARVNNITDVTNIPAGLSLYIPSIQTPSSHVDGQQANSAPAQQLQMVAEGSGVQNIQIVASRHRIGAPSSSSTAAYPNGPQVSIGVASAPVAMPAPTQATFVQAVPSVSPAQTVAQPVVQSQQAQSVQSVQPVGGFVPQDQSPKQQLLQQQMVLLRESGPKLAIFQPPLQEFAWPLGISGRISSNYGSRKLAITSNRFHYGLDVAALTGTKVKASKAGIVKEASWIGGYGNAVYINHPDGTQTRYAHMSELNVSEGDTVAQGDVIGAVGSTGVSTGPHLHFEIRVKGYAVDPLEYLVQP